MKRLTFTEQDRQRVFAKLKAPSQARTPRLLPLIATLFLVVIAASFVASMRTDSNVATPPPAIKTVLLALQDTSNRIPITLLVTIDDNTRTIHAASIPRDTHTEIGKLAFATSDEQLTTTVEQLFSTTIDNTYVRTLSQLNELDAVMYTIREAMQVRAIEQASFHLEAGTQTLNAEQLASLLLTATNYGTFTTGDTDIQQLTTLWLQHFHESAPFTTAPLHEYTIKAISLHDGMQPARLDEQYVVRFDKAYLQQAKDALYSFEK